MTTRDYDELWTTFKALKMLKYAIGYNPAQDTVVITMAGLKQNNVDIQKALAHAIELVLEKRGHHRFELYDSSKDTFR